MKSFIINKKHYTTILLFVVILLLGIILRHDRFGTIPRHGATFDEFAWTWLGINIIQKHTPTSWSSQPQYNNRYHLKYQGATFWIVTPYLEHPPLFGLIAGSFALISGAKDMYDVTLGKIRPLAIILGGFSIFMVFILSKEIYGKAVGLLSSLLYATVPTIVIGSRIVQNENFLIPLWLSCLYLILKYLKSGKKRLRNTAGILAGLLSLAKVPWLVVGLSLSMILSFKGKWKDAFLIGGITAFIFSTFIIYGLLIDKELFLNLWKLQLARYDISYAGFFSIFKDPLLVDRYYLDGWILFGWFSALLLMRDLKKNFIVLIPFIAYFIAFIFAIPNEPAHGWYRYPFYPFLIIATAASIYEEFKKISMVSIFFCVLVGLSLLSNFWQNTFGFSYSVYRLLILFWTVPVLIILWRNIKGKFPFMLMLSWLMLFIIFNIATVLSYIE